MLVSSKSIGTLWLTWKLPRHWSYTLSMLTWNLRQAAITAQVMHSRLSAGAIIQGWGSRNTGTVAWTEISNLCSFFTVLLLNMCMPSWVLIIWRRLESQVAPSWSTALMSLVYHKKCHQHSYQAASKRQEYSPLGSCMERQNIFSLKQKPKLQRGWEGFFLISPGFFTIRMGYPGSVFMDSISLQTSRWCRQLKWVVWLIL